MDEVFQGLSAVLPMLLVDSLWQSETSEPKEDTETRAPGKDSSGVEASPTIPLPLAPCVQCSSTSRTKPASCLPHLR